MLISASFGDTAVAAGGGPTGARYWFTRHSMVTIYGVSAITFMMAMYALERHRRGFV